MVNEKQITVKEKELFKEEQGIFDYWVSQDIIKHRKINDEMGRRIRSLFNPKHRSWKSYTKAQIKNTIDRYSMVYHDDNYFFNYKFTLHRFLCRDIFEKFLRKGEHWLNYQNRKNKGNKNIRNDKANKCKSKIDDNIKVDIVFKKKYKNLLKQLRTMTYDEYLKTEHWKHFRDEAMKFADYKCQLCNKNDCKLIVHHNNYQNRGKETFNDVIVLCEECHKKVHNN